MCLRLHVNQFSINIIYEYGISQRMYGLKYEIYNVQKFALSNPQYQHILWYIYHIEMWVNQLATCIYRNASPDGFLSRDVENLSTLTVGDILQKGVPWARANEFIHCKAFFSCRAIRYNGYSMIFMEIMNLVCITV